MRRTLTALTALAALTLTGCGGTADASVGRPTLQRTASAGTVTADSHADADFTRPGVTVTVPDLPAPGIAEPVTADPADPAWLDESVGRPTVPVPAAAAPQAESVGRPTVPAPPAEDAGPAEFEQCMAMLAAKHPDAAGTCYELDGAPANPDTDGDGVWDTPANTFDEAAAQCEANLPHGSDALSECVNAAIVEWCQFTPFRPGDPHYSEAVDGRCL